MLIPHKGHTDTIQVYSVSVMTHVKALQAGHSSQGTSEPITPAFNKATCNQPEVYDICLKSYNTNSDVHFRVTYNFEIWVPV